MSQFNKTIDFDSFQAGNGQVTTAAFAALVNVRDIEAKKGIIIANNDATDVLLIKTTKNQSTGTNYGFRLPPGEIVTIELRNPAEIRVRGLADTCDYSWLAY